MPGDAEITAATLPSKGLASARLHQSTVFFSRGVTIELYSGDATRRPWCPATIPISLTASAGSPCASSRSPL
jgi:hypothetical protein